MGKYRHLTREDREQIAIMRAAGCANGAIASSIGKSPATISRELHRNSLASGRYSANVADGAYMERRQRSARLERDANLAAFVRQRLSEAPSRRLQAIVCRATGSPQQISGWLRSGAEPRFGAMAMTTNPSGASETDFRDAVCDALSLEADTPDEAILTALNATQPGAPDPAKYVPIEAVIELLRDRHSATELMSEDAAKSKVHTALNDGTPAMTDWALSLCSSDPESFDSFLETTAPAYAHLLKPMNDNFNITSLNNRSSMSKSGDAGAIAEQLGIDPKDLT